jgi:hypothetical protein
VGSKTYRSDDHVVILGQEDPPLLGVPLDRFVRTRETVGEDGQHEVHHEDGVHKLRDDEKPRRDTASRLHAVIHCVGPVLARRHAEQAREGRRRNLKVHQAIFRSVAF